MALAITVNAVRFLNQLIPTPNVAKDNQGTDASIGCPMLAEIDVTITDATWPSSRIVLNPALFLASGIGREPLDMLVGYGALLPSTATTGNVFVLNLYTGTAYAESSKNRGATMEITGSTTATISFSFIPTMDLGEYITGSVQQNADRLLKSHKNAPFRNYNIYGSVYRDQDRSLGLRLVFDDSTGARVVFRHVEPYQSRFYLRGLPNGSADGPLGEMVPGYEFELMRGGVVVDDLSIHQATEARIRFFDASPFVPTTQFKVYVLDITDGPNSVDYLTQYGTTGAIVTTSATTDQDLGQHVRGLAPSIDTVTIGPDSYWVLQFKVGTDLNPARRYSIAVVAVGFPTTGNTYNSFTNSYLRHDLPATGLPAAIALTADDFKGTILDYNQDPFMDNVESTVVDFLLCKVKVSAPVYDAGAASSGYGTTWNSDMRSIKFRLEDFNTGEFLWQTDFFKVGSVWTGSGSNVVQATVLGDSWVEYAVQLHGCFPNTAGFPDLSGRTVRVRWFFGIDYPFGSWHVDYRYDQKVFFRPYKNFTEVIDAINLYDYETGLPIDSLCRTELVLVEVLLDPAKVLGLTWNIRVSWSVEPDGFNFNAEQRPAGVHHEEAYAGNLPQLDDSAITELPATFNGSGVALFVFDPSVLMVGERARLHVIAEPLGDCCDAGQMQITSTYPGLSGLFTAIGENMGHVFYEQDGGGAFLVTWGSGVWMIEDNLGTMLFTAESDALQPCVVLNQLWVAEAAAVGTVITSICGSEELEVPCPAASVNTAGAFSPGFIRFQLGTEGSQPAGWTPGSFQVRINGGAWTVYPFPGYNVINDYPYTAGTVWEARIYNAARPDCPPDTSGPFTVT